MVQIMKNKRFFAMVAMVVLLGCVCVLAACNNHEHTYRDEWSMNEICHWHDADCNTDKCSYPNSRIDVAEHDFDDNDICTVCGHDLSQYKTYAIVQDNVEYSLSGTRSFYYVSGYQGSEVYDENGAATLPNGADREVTLAEYLPYPAEPSENVAQIMLPVSRIAKNAFKDEISIKSFQISKNIEYIGESAFEGCTNLKTISLVSITLEDNALDFGKLKYISKGAFEGCTQIDELTLSFIGERLDCEGATHLGYIFGTDSPLDSGNADFSIANLTVYGDTYIRNYAFYGCNISTAQIICSAIGKSAFENCKTLEQVVILGITTLENATFRGCSNLQYALIDEVKSVDPTVFEGCDKLQYNQLDNAYYLPSLSSAYSLLMKATSTDIKSCNIYKETKYINEGAFENCTQLAQITIGNSISKIEKSVFKNCTNLQTINYDGTAENWEKMWGSSVEQKEEGVEYYNVVCQDKTLIYEIAGLKKE